MSISKQLTLIPQFLLQVPVCITELWWFEWEQSPQSLVLHMVHSGWWNFWKFRWFSLAEICHLQFSLFSLCMLLKDMISQLPVPSCASCLLLCFFLNWWMLILLELWNKAHTLYLKLVLLLFFILTEKEHRKALMSFSDGLVNWMCKLNPLLTMLLLQSFITAKSEKHFHKTHILSTYFSFMT